MTTGLCRRDALLLGASALIAPGLARPAAAAPPRLLAEQGEWRDFLARFMAPDGRIVDTGNEDISHSEGQGWALYCAVRFEDRASFEHLWHWTRRHLARREDALLAWRWRPGRVQTAEDLNNAVDGDLFAAAALVLAGEVWAEPGLTERGRAIARDLLRHCLRRAGPWLVLLPGVQGFEAPDRLVINPSYYAFPALLALAEAVPDPLWLRLVRDGLAMLREARFGAWGLPPDWLAVARADGSLSLPTSRRPRFSYDAVRIPLYLAWAGMGEEPALEKAVAFWGNPTHRQMPAWVDLASNRLAPYAAPPGIRAVAMAAQVGRGSILPADSLPRVSYAVDYYSGVLSLLSRLAMSDMRT